ncbi:selenouridine synthase SelU-like subunit [Methanocaldococcus fervens]|uniref:Rhodanese domain protein n=1 Tax=Methanocaldococcus fervens (strain DSM 4213 / JCM 15782 / AG86) TaxID=573064 RepID=C7P962_METFA|nr:selenouridine synthase SelU-like subunit [Methanocaldococcus fervens]ACV25094.1 Rhodanese domain protein [Methanocaldococcus fervens AG86]
MDEEILARLVTFTEDVVLCIVLNDGRKMITNGKKILAGKIEGELASFILNTSKEFLKDKKVGVMKFKDYDVYFERIDINKFLKTIGGELVKNTITVSDLLKLMDKEDVIIVDTRSPREFKEDTIPGAINIPLFLDEEHALIGKIYKQEGREKAIDVAIDIIEKGLKRILNEAKKLDRDKLIVVFCARGGMRSQTMALILQLLGFKVKRLIGGFKAFKHAKQNL